MTLIDTLFNFLKFLLLNGKTIKMRILIFASIIFLSQNVFAANIYGHGQQGCIEYITHYNNSHQNYFNYKKDGEVTLPGKKIAEMFELQSYIDYFEGYVSGYNAKTNGDFFGIIEPRVIAVELKNYCEQFPGKEFIYAVVTVANKNKK